MTVPPPRSRPPGARPTVGHLSWLTGAYFLGAVFVSIAHQLFGAPPAADGPPSAYHRAWCCAQFAGLRVELETQARGALAGAAFDRLAAEHGRWYGPWAAWHRRAAAACQLPAATALTAGLAELGALGASLDRQCGEALGPSRDRLLAIDRQLQAVKAGGQG